jgi:hypothetical protein
MQKISANTKFSYKTLTSSTINKNKINNSLNELNKTHSEIIKINIYKEMPEINKNEVGIT